LSPSLPRVLDLSLSLSLSLSATHFCIPSGKTNQASLCRKIPCTFFLEHGSYGFMDLNFFLEPSLPLITTSIPPSVYLVIYIWSFALGFSWAYDAPTPECYDAPFGRNDLPFEG
jgi:hypothetical protein